jgi:GntR family transcriptional regulator
MSAITRTSATPYYEQLYDVLLERVRTGSIRPGERLPGESELHREFGLSRATVRQALELLQAHGWATKVPHRGYFASVPEERGGWRIQGESGFLDSGIGAGGARVTTDVLRATVGTLPDHATEALGAGRDSSGFILNRLRHVDDQPVLVSTNFTPPAVAPIVASATGVLNGTTSLTHALRDGGYTPATSRRVLHALPAPTELASHLRIAPGAPLLRIRSTTCDRSGFPYDYYETWLRTDRIPLELNTTTGLI